MSSRWDELAATAGMITEKANYSIPIATLGMGMSLMHLSRVLMLDTPALDPALPDDLPNRARRLVKQIAASVAALFA